MINYNVSISLRIKYVHANQSCTNKVGKQKCDMNDGYCLNGCKQGFWSDSCNQSYSDGCINSECDRKDGTCSCGCKDRLIGEKCTEILGAEVLSF